MFLLREGGRDKEGGREREGGREGKREREREREYPKQAPCCQRRAGGGARSHEP